MKPGHEPQVTDMGDVLTPLLATLEAGTNEQMGQAGRNSEGST